MRIIHTSDLHLGQNFFTKSRRAEHQAFFDWLLQVVKEKQVDAVVIAGDVFDTGTPPSYARELYNQFIVRMSESNVQLVILGGNHDSVSTLNESKGLLACLNTQVVANTSEDFDKQVVELRSKGEVTGLLCAIPFVRARDVLTSASGESGSQKQQALGDAISQHYMAVYQHAVAKSKAMEKSLPIIATGHLTALGVKTSESVRDIYIGTLDGFDAKGFPPADYIALGHIHRPQIVAKQPHIRYSGSPIYLSFDELKSTKQVVLVEFEGKVPTITPIDVPTFQPMVSLKGDLSDIESKLSTLPYRQDESVWLSIEVDTQDYLTDLHDRIQRLVDDSEWEVLQLRRTRGVRNQSLTSEHQQELSELTPSDVFEKRINQEVFEGEDDQARKARITQKFAQIVAEVEGESE